MRVLDIKLSIKLPDACKQKAIESLVKAIHKNLNEMGVVSNKLDVEVSDD